MRELVLKSCDGVSFKKPMRMSHMHAIICKQTWRANLKKKKFRNSCGSFFQFQNIYRMNRRHCSSVLDIKEKSMRFAGASIDLSDRHTNYSHGAKQRSLVLFVEQTQMKMKIPLNLE